MQDARCWLLVAGFFNGIEIANFSLKKSMKTHKHLFAKIVTFKNLLLAAQEAAAGKREQFYAMGLP